jgi:hypothetical protein
MPARRKEAKPPYKPINGRRDQNYIIGIDKNGERMNIHFVRDNGEVVIGEFKLVGWGRPPKDTFDDTMERLSHPPQTIWHSQAKRGQGPLPRGQAKADGGRRKPS